MTYQQIAYVSLANTPPSQDDIDRLLISARQFNQTHGVTGVLLCQKNTFFQFFEGPPESVKKVYERVRQSTMHQNILELYNATSEKRCFDTWCMGFCYVPKSDIQALAHAEWMQHVADINHKATESFGLKMLKEFWFRLHQKEANQVVSIQK